MDHMNRCARVATRRVLVAGLGAAVVAFGASASASTPDLLSADVTAAGDAVELTWAPYTFPTEASCAGQPQSGHRQILASSRFNGGPWLSAGNTQAMDISLTVEDLAEGSYEFRIMATCNRSGGSGNFESDWSAARTVDIILAPPCAGPPDVLATATPTLLWPPNGKLVPVIVSGSVVPQANCSMPAEVLYFVDDEYEVLSSDVTTAVLEDGTFEFLVDLEAMRYGQDMDGRLYEIGIETADEGSTSIQVIVPHDQRRR